MVLAAISFGDPLMLAGLLAALVPVGLHLLNRMRAPVVPFPTLRFLKITAQKTARRRQLQQYFLLLVRVVVFALVAMAVAAPLIRGGSAALAYGFVGLLLGALGLLVLAAVVSVSAVNAVQARPAAVRTQAKAAPGGPPREQPTALLLGVSIAALVAAVGLGGYSAYGLASERYFSSAAPGVVSGQSTAMVIIYDNSHSMLASDDGPGGKTRLERARDRVKELGLVKAPGAEDPFYPSEVAVLLTNPGATTGATRFWKNVSNVSKVIEDLKPQGSAQPMRERIATAIDMLTHDNDASQATSKMLVIVSDFAQPAFSDGDVFAALNEMPGRGDLQVVLMPVGKPDAGGAGAGGGAAGPTGVADVGIVSFRLAEGTQRPVVGAEVTLEARVINNGEAAAVRDIELTVDGKAVENTGAAGTLDQQVRLGPVGAGDSRQTLRVPYRLTEAGEHRFGVRIKDAPDGMAWDDQRELMLEVADQVKVLVVGGDAGNVPRARSAGFYFDAALAPFAGAAGAEGKIPWSVKPVYRGVEQVQTAAALKGYAAVFMCDVPKVSEGLADALAGYARGGGRVVWVLGPSVDSAQYNQVLLGTGADGMPRKLLPAALAQPMVAAKADVLDWVDMQSGLFMNLFDSEDPFRTALITGRWALSPNASGRVLARTGDGSALVMQHAAGAGNAGQIYTLLTTPGAQWSNLAATTLLVPLASRMALGDMKESGERTSFETGEMVDVHVPELPGANPAALAKMSLDVTTPGNGVENVRPVVTGNVAQWNFAGAQAAGEYGWKSSDGKYAGGFVVNPPGVEADLQSADMAALARASSPGAEVKGGRGTIVAYSMAQMLGQMAHRAEGTSLMPGFVSLVLILAVVEMMLANRRGAG